MKSLRCVRICLEIIFLISTALYFAGAGGTLFGSLSHHTQILTLMLAQSAGVVAVWLAVTFLWGRIYCSTVCPAGALIDIFTAIRMKFFKNRNFRFSKAGRLRYLALCIYVALLIFGIYANALITDPWILTGNIGGAFGSQPAHLLWKQYGIGAGLGAGIGILSLLILAGSGLFLGRDYCNTICPTGLTMSLISARSLCNIVFEPDKCTSCMKCEEVCKASCIKVSERFVDNSRCVRCFDCLDVCRDKALRMRTGAPGAATPMMRRTDSKI